MTNFSLGQVFIYTVELSAKQLMLDKKRNTTDDVKSNIDAV